MSGFLMLLFLFFLLQCAGSHEKNITRFGLLKTIFFWLFLIFHLVVTIFACYDIEFCIKHLKNQLFHQFTSNFRILKTQRSTQSAQTQDTKRRPTTWNAIMVSFSSLSYPYIQQTHKQEIKILQSTNKLKRESKQGLP